MNGIKNADMKSWMSSAFGSSNSNIDSEKKISRIKPSGTKPKANTLVKKISQSESISAQFSNRIERPHAKVKQLIAEKYKPKNRSELIVNKAKVRDT